MQTLSEIRQLLDERGLKPKHRLGQNFLHDKNQIAKLMEAAHLRPGELALEVGPGTGTLTEALLDHGANVVACELDRDLAALLGDRLGSRITLIEADALAKQRQLNPAVLEALGGREFKLVANLPYQIASPLISTLLIDHPPPGCIGQFVTIQREVADRLMAKPGTKEYGALTIIVQALADVRRISTLSPSCFWPPPEVTSAMVAINPHQAGEHRFSAAENARDFARFVTDLFTKRRKQLGTILGRDRAGWPAGLSVDVRPEALTPEQIVELWRALGRPDVAGR